MWGEGIGYIIGAVVGMAAVAVLWPCVLPYYLLLKATGRL